MTVVDVLTAALVLVLGIVTMMAIYIGIMGMLGVTRLTRCDTCGHLGVTPADEPLLTCTYCRHERLLHPVHAMHRVS